MNGFEIFLPFIVFAEYRKLTEECEKSQDWTAWLAFIQKHRVVVKWDCKDRDGNALDPDKKDDWSKLSIGATAHLLKAINLHIGGASAAAGN